MIQQAPQILLINALIIWGIYFASHGRILDSLRQFINYKIGLFLSKPLFECPVCMSSAWGALPFVLVVAMDVVFSDLAQLCNLIYVFPYWLALAGLNGLIEKVVILLDTIIDYFKLKAEIEEEKSYNI